LAWLLYMQAAVLSNNRKLFQILGTSRLSGRKSDKFCGISDLIFNSFLNKITECVYYNEPNLEVPG